MTTKKTWKDLVVRSAVFGHDLPMEGLGIVMQQQSPKAPSWSTANGAMGTIKVGWGGGASTTATWRFFQAKPGSAFKRPMAGIDLEIARH
jgi:hypothetical protein